MNTEELREVAERTVVALAAVSVSAGGPDAAALAVTLTPIAEATLRKLVDHVLGPRRRKNAAEALADAAYEAGATNATELLDFVEGAVSDERCSELLIRGLTIAQDCALRAKRRAAGRSIATGVADKGTRVDPELLFLRALDDLDAPHFRLLALINESPPHHGHPDRPRSAVPLGWTPADISAMDPALADTVKTLAAALLRHNLIQQPSGPGITTADKNGEVPYSVTDYGRLFVARLAEQE